MNENVKTYLEDWAKPEGPRLVYVEGRAKPAAPPPDGHRWLSVRTGGQITGWRISTEAEECRFAQAERFAKVQSDFETAVLTETEIERAHSDEGRENPYRGLWDGER